MATFKVFMFGSSDACATALFATSPHASLWKRRGGRGEAQGLGGGTRGPYEPRLEEAPVQVASQVDSLQNAANSR